MTIETTESPTTESGDSTASRDDLIAAVREAGGTESVDVVAEAAAAGVEPPKVEPTAQETQQTDEPPIYAKLKAREADMRKRDEARSAADELLARARTEADRMMQEAREKAEREWQAELDRKRQQFSASPTEAIRALGDPEKIVDAVLKDGTPEGRAIQDLQRKLAETEKKAGAGEDARKQLEDFRKELQQQQHAQLVAQVRDRFFSTSATPEKAPYLHARYDQDEIFNRADQKAAEWQRGGMKLGVDFDFDDVTQYLELESKKRIASLAQPPAQQSGAGAPAKEPGIAPKSAANGTRTLSAAQGSERRTSPKPLSEMKPDEARAALIEEVAAARRANPDAVF